MQKVFRGGALALGIAIGAGATLLALILLEIFDVIPLKDSAFSGAIIGAIVGGLIGFIGQVIVIIQSASREDEVAKSLEKSKLQLLLSITTRAISMYAQLKKHAESQRPLDQISVGTLPALMKPVIVSESRISIPLDLIVMSLDVGMPKLYNLLNVLDTNLRNFDWIHKSYQVKVEDILGEISRSGDVKFEDGKMQGEVRVNRRSYFEALDFQQHYWDITYNGLVVSKAVSDLVIDALAKRHEKRIDLSDVLSEDEWRDLFDSVIVTESLPQEFKADSELTQ